MKKVMVCFSLLSAVAFCNTVDVQTQTDSVKNDKTAFEKGDNSFVAKIRNFFSPKDNQPKTTPENVIENDKKIIETDNVLKEQLAQIQEGKDTEYTVNAEDTVRVAQTDNVFNEIASRIAGLSDDVSPEYQKYAKPISTRWQRLCDLSLSKVRPWAKQNIDSYVKDIKRVLYVFGGPDFSYAFQFFPYAEEYILVGLEPIGNFNRIKKLVDEGKLNLFSTAINSYLDKGYFITSEMGTQLSRENGGLGVIMLQLARMNCDIVSIESRGINQNGEIVDDDKNVLSVVKVSFKKNDSSQSDRISTIYYIRIDVNNANTNRLNMLMNFSKKQEFLTFVKSASYILQDRNFTIIRNFILNNTKAILQDDTGVAFSILRKWDLHIFGQYTGATLPIFKNYTQSNMIEYYNTHKAIPIDFMIGYGFRQNRPALMLALPPETRALYSNEVVVPRQSVAELQLVKKKDIKPTHSSVEIKNGLLDNLKLR